MPGKVNPSIPEMVNQVCYQVIGCDAAILGGGRRRPARIERHDAGHRLERAPRLVDPSRGDACLHRALRRTGIRADEARCRELLDRSTAVATALSPYIGYAATAEIAKASVQSGRPVRELVRERRLLSDAQLDAILSPEAMTTPGVAGTERKTDGRDTRARRAA